MTTRIPTVDVGPLGFDGGAHLVVARALVAHPGGAVAVVGRNPDLRTQLATWCREEGHRFRPLSSPASADGGPRPNGGVVERGRWANARWRNAPVAGHPDPAHPGAVADEPPTSWGMAPRGATIESGGPSPRFRLGRRVEHWSPRAADLYRQAAAGQWDPATAVDWSQPIEHDLDVEAAVVQLMTFLIENEEAALIVPARFLGEVHPHFREVQQLLAVTVADEARHIEVFTRRAVLTGLPLGRSSAAGRTSLQTLLDEPDFATASFLLSVMGEGTFLSLLGFVERNAPDGVTRDIVRLARADEARHVAFAMAHLTEHGAIEPALRRRLARAVEHRNAALRSTSGLGDDIFDSLVVVAAGGLEPEAIGRAWSAVQDLQVEMTEGRRHRLARLGFSDGEAEALSSLHTRNFM